jgi:hypothetical protein
VLSAEPRESLQRYKTALDRSKILIADVFILICGALITSLAQINDELRVFSTSCKQEVCNALQKRAVLL